MTVLHLGQAMATKSPSLRLATSAGEVIGFIIIERTLGEAAMPSSPTGLYWACAGPAKENRAMATSAASGVLFIVCISYSFFYSERRSNLTPGTLTQSIQEIGRAHV